MKLQETIKCELCGMQFKTITWRHLKKSHNITISDYREQFPSAPTSSPASKKRKSLSSIKTNKSRIGVPRSTATIDKIKQTKKENPKTSWNAGVPMSAAAKKHLSNLKKEAYASGSCVHWNAGNKTSPITRERIRNTSLAQHRTFSDDSRQKRDKTIADKRDGGWEHHGTIKFNEVLYASDNPLAYQHFYDSNWLHDQHITNKVSIAGICVLLGIDCHIHRTTVRNRMKLYNIPIHRYTQNISAPQLEIEQFLSSLDIEFNSNIRTLIPPYELDIYIPEFKLAIEYNGLYWHSEAGGKKSDYHINKTLLCADIGIRLIHIFEDEWRDMKQQCKDTLLHFFEKSNKGVYARTTSIREIPWKQAKEFLNKYHLLKAGTSGSYRIGAFTRDNQLIGVMVFGRQNNERAVGTELKRFVTNKKNNPGLGSKMFAFALREKRYSKVIAFVDRRWFTGLVKNYIGFKVVDYTKPAIWWTDGRNRYHRRFETKQTLIASGADPSLSKRDMLDDLGFTRIWDSGKVKLEFISPNNPQISPT